jgi:RsiW-degrading membrane proteinase PrsW (M82 family)
MVKRPGGAMTQGSDLPTRSQLVPILTKWNDLRERKGQMAPFIFCIVAFFGLSSFTSDEWIVWQFSDSKGNPTNPLGWIYTSSFLIGLALILTTASLYLIYKLVGKNKSWWSLIAAMAFTGYFLWRFQTQDDFTWLYDLFHKDLAGGEADARGSFLSLLINNILGTGFFEEFVKGIPVLLVAIATPYMAQDMKRKYGLEEPLDGILLGAASGGGFAIVETLGQYVSGDMAKLWFKTGLAMEIPAKIQNNPKALQQVLSHLTPAQAFQAITAGYKLLGTSSGVESTIIRSIDLSFGHMAFAGYFGYFVGLAVIKPEKRWKILAIGLVSAAIPHALWDSLLESQLDMPPLVAATALLSFGVLAAAILKAREISPNRALLAPSIVFSPSAAPQPYVAAAAPAAPAYVPVASAPLSTPAAAAPAFTPAPPASNGKGQQLRVGTKFLAIVSGLRLLEHQVPGLSSSAPGGAVAEITPNPNDPQVLGLKNTSSSAWEVISGSGSRRPITTGQTLRLSPGTKINFGITEGEVF